jgi:hypothetical protein
MGKYTLVKIQAHEGETPEGRLLDVVVISLIDDNPENALNKAKNLVTKKFYRIAEITEFYDQS